MLKYTIVVSVFLLSALEIYAQKNDTITFDEVTISDKLDTAKYFWYLWNLNKKNNIKDTAIYYHVELTNEIPDSNWIEKFKGIIRVEYKNNEEKRFLCSGHYESSYTMKLGVVLGTGAPRYLNKLRKTNKKLKFSKFIKYNTIKMHNDTFIVIAYRKKKPFSKYYYVFNDKILIHEDWLSYQKKTKGLLHVKINYDEKKTIFDGDYVSSLRTKFYYTYKNIKIRNITKYTAFSPEELKSFEKNRNTQAEKELKLWRGSPRSLKWLLEKK